MGNAMSQMGALLDGARARSWHVAQRIWKYRYNEGVAFIAAGTQHSTFCFSEAASLNTITHFWGQIYNGTLAFW
jgi:hypothetical protein